MVGFLEDRDSISLTLHPLQPLKQSILHRIGAKELFVEMHFTLSLYLNKPHLNKTISQTLGFSSSLQPSSSCFVFERLILNWRDIAVVLSLSVI